MTGRSARPKARQTYEWTRGVIANIGVVTPFPYEILFAHIRERNLFHIIGQFFDDSTTKITLLDQCVFQQFWWIDPNIIRARYSKIEHPTHYSGEYVFDRENGERTILEVRQPDIDGKHWRADHIHVKRGSMDENDYARITRPTFNEHIELERVPIPGVYIMRVPQT
jgi:hypothetical protein